MLRLSAMPFWFNAYRVDFVLAQWDGAWCWEKIIRCNIGQKKCLITTRIFYILLVLGFGVGARCVLPCHCGTMDVVCNLSFILTSRWPHIWHVPPTNSFRRCIMNESTNPLSSKIPGSHPWQELLRVIYLYGQCSFFKRIIVATSCFCGALVLPFCNRSTTQKGVFFASIEQLVGSIGGTLALLLEWWCYPLNSSWTQ